MLASGNSLHVTEDVVQVADTKSDIRYRHAFVVAMHASLGV